MPSLWDRYVKGLFRLWSPFYDLAAPQRLVYRRAHRAVLAALDGRHADVVVDLGCGTGQLTLDLARRFPAARVVGLDLSRPMLVEARRRAGGAFAVARVDAHDLPIASGIADIITNTFSYHWYRDPDRALGEIHRVLRPGGRYVLATATQPLPISLHAGLAGRLPGRGETRRRLRGAGLVVRREIAIFPIMRVYVADRA